jgi:O-antigen/teichoic acid export membrane protein
VSGVTFGLFGYVTITMLGMATLCFLLSLITRHFLSGLMLVVLTVALTVLLALLLLASGMAKSDFVFIVWFPYCIFGAVIGVVWMLGMKGRKSNG